MKRILVTGAGGFIGSHLVRYLKERSYWVRGVDLKLPEFQKTVADQFEILDLRRWDACLEAMRGIDEVYALAADMGGMGFIQTHHAEILRNNSLINIHTLDAARLHGVDRLFYSSSACVYPNYKQTAVDAVSLKEEDAYPADPQDAYGWEKLVTERLCQHYRESYGIETRVARFHNIMGARGTWEGGREKAPAAICRKVAEAKWSGRRHIDIWGDGEQTRSFCHVDDCVEGIYHLMRSDYAQALNIGRDELTSINHLVDVVCEIAGVRLEKKHIDGPLGVRGRNSDNTRCRQVLGWEPSIDLQEGLALTYGWVEEQVRARLVQTPPELDRR